MFDSDWNEVTGRDDYKALKPEQKAYVQQKWLDDQTKDREDYKVLKPEQQEFVKAKVFGDEYDPSSWPGYQGPKLTMEPPPVENSDQGFWGSTASALAGGVVDTAETLARVARAVPGGEAAGQDQGGISSKIIGKLNDLKRAAPMLRQQDKGGEFDDALYGGLRSAVTSLTAGAPGAAAGAAIGTVLGPAGTAVGAIIGGIAGYALSGGTLFGMAEYDRAVEEGHRHNQLNPDKPMSQEEIEHVGLYSSMLEGGLEFATDIIEGATFKLGTVLTAPTKAVLREGLKDLIGTTVKKTLGRVGTIAAVETGAEMLTAVGQTEVRNRAGMSDTRLWDAAAQAFGPSLVASLIFAGVAEGGAYKLRAKTARALQSPDVDDETRFNVIDQVYEQIKAVDPGLASIWAANAERAVAMGETIPIDEDVANLKLFKSDAEQAVAAAEKRVYDEALPKEERVAAYQEMQTAITALRDMRQREQAELRRADRNYTTMSSLEEEAEAQAVGESQQPGGQAFARSERPRAEAQTPEQQAELHAVREYNREQVKNEFAKKVTAPRIAKEMETLMGTLPDSLFADDIASKTAGNMVGRLANLKNRELYLKSKLRSVGADPATVQEISRVQASIKQVNDNLGTLAERSAYDFKAQVQAEKQQGYQQIGAEIDQQKEARGLAQDFQAFHDLYQGNEIDGMDEADAYARYKEFVGPAENIAGIDDSIDTPPAPFMLPEDQQAVFDDVDRMAAQDAGMFPPEAPAAEPGKQPAQDGGLRTAPNRQSDMAVKFQQWRNREMSVPGEDTPEEAWRQSMTVKNPRTAPSRQTTPQAPNPLAEQYRQWRERGMEVPEPGTTEDEWRQSITVKNPRTAPNRQANQFSDTGKMVDQPPDTGKLTLDEFEAKGLRPADVTKAQWVDIMRRNRRQLGQDERSGTAAAPYADYEEYWERDTEARNAETQQPPTLPADQRTTEQSVSARSKREIDRWTGILADKGEAGVERLKNYLESRPADEVTAKPEFIEWAKNKTQGREPGKPSAQDKAAPSFPDYDAFLQHMNTRSQEYGSKGEYYASDEYRQIADIGKELFEAQQVARLAGAESAMKTAGVKYGDRVEYTQVSPFLQAATYEGVLKQGARGPYVAIDKVPPGAEARSRARWHQGWIKAQEAAPEKAPEPAPTPEQQPPAPAPEAKKPTELWENSGRAYLKGITDPDERAVMLAAHANSTREAVAAGKPVADGVLHEYRNNGWAQIEIERRAAIEAQNAARSPEKVPTPAPVTPQAEPEAPPRSSTKAERQEADRQRAAVDNALKNEVNRAKSKKGSFTVTLQDGATREISGTIFGDYASHIAGQRNQGVATYGVTHIPSGMLIKQGMRAPEGRELAYRLSLMPEKWDGKDKENIPEAFKKMMAGTHDDFLWRRPINKFQAQADQDGQAWWDELTGTGRAQAIEAAGLKMSNQVWWKHIPEDRQKALLAVRGTLPVDQPAPAPDTTIDASKTPVDMEAATAGLEKYDNTEESETAQADTAKTAETPHFKLSSWVLAQIRFSKKFDSKALFEAANGFYNGTQGEGAYTPKDAYDAIELGVNRYIASMDVFNAGTDSAVEAGVNLRTLMKIMNLIPTQTKRTQEQQEFQQFSTPPSLAYLATWAAKPGKDDTFLEPSAGIGGIAVFGKVAGSKVIVNELSPRRVEFLKEMGFDQVFTENAEQLDNVLPADVKPTVVVMNPPFSSTAGRVAKNATMNGAKHIEQALTRLEPNGRLVAIVGQGMGMSNSTFRTWWEGIKGKYNVRANIAIAGDEYSKYGTTFDNRMLIIDKTGPTAKDATILTNEVESYAELVPVLEGIRNDRPAILGQNEAGERPAAEPSGVQAPEGNARQPDSGGLAARLPTGDASARPEPVQPRPGPDGSNAQADVVEQPGKDDLAAGPGREAVPDDNRRDSEARPGERGRIPDDGRGGRAVTTVKADQKAKTELSDKLFDKYIPKTTVKGAQPHPTALDQSTAMADTELPDTNYTPNITEEAISSGALSDAQIEAIIYAGDAHSKRLPDGSRKGFFIGDGTGVGKGREITGIIMDNFAKGDKKAIWISKNGGLVKDAKRDVGNVWPEGLEKLFLLDSKTAPTGEKVKTREGIMFVGYQTASNNFFQHIDPTKPSTHTNLEARLGQIIEWAGPDYDGVIAFDESHMMANSTESGTGRNKKKPSQMAIAGKFLAKALPNAKVVYVSATGATEVSNLAYADRLGLWGEGTPFDNVTKFITDISSGGVAVMEQVARDLKSMGLYIARALSYDGVKHETLTHVLTDEQRANYDAMADAWQVALNNFNEALEVTGAGKDAKGHAMAQFWGANQRFFSAIVTSMQMPTVFKRMEEDLKNGYAVILQLVNTGQAGQDKALARQEEGQDLEELDMSPMETLIGLVEGSFPTAQYEEYTDENGNTQKRPVIDSNGNPVQNREAVAKKQALIEHLASINAPSGPLEYLLDTFGPDKVAEVTGRSKRVVLDPKTGRKVKQGWSKKKSEADAQRFMDAHKDILVFSDAGGTGMSFHSDMAAKNQKPRKHYLVQPGWRAAQAVQGLGRSHRSNQKHPPEFVLVSTDLKGQKRFLSTIARRLEQLGALTTGERRTSSKGLFQAKDNLESVYATEALTRFINDLVNGAVAGIDRETFEAQTGLTVVGPEGGIKFPEMRQFLNRLLSMKIDHQNATFDAFSERLDLVVELHAQNGTLDVGIETINGLSVTKNTDDVVYEDKGKNAKTRYVNLDIETENSLRIPFDSLAKNRQFYKNIRSGQVWAASSPATVTDRQGNVQEVRYLSNAAGGRQAKYVSELDNTERWEPTSRKDARPMWDEAYAKTPATLTQNVHLLAGSLLPIWDKIHGSSTIYRTQTNDGERILGRVVPDSDIHDVLESLGAKMAARSQGTIDIFKEVLTSNSRVQLDSGTILKRSLVANELRVEIVLPPGGGTSMFSRLESYGAFTEIINWKRRAFLPKDNMEVYVRLTKNDPVVRVHKQGADIADSPGEYLAEPTNEDTHKFIDMDEQAAPLFPDMEHPAISVHMQTTGRIAAAGKVVKNINDAAALLAHIRKAAQENLYVVATNKRGTVLEIHRYGNGVKNAANADPVEIVGRLFNTPGVTTAYVAHNHPAKDPSPSGADEAFTKGVQSFAALKDIDVHSFVIGGTSWMQVLGDNRSNRIRPTLRKTKLPVKERTIRATSRFHQGIRVNTSGDAVNVLQNAYQNQEGFLFLDNKNHVVGFLPYPRGTAMRDAAAQIIAKAEATNANGIVFNQADRMATLQKEGFLSDLRKSLEGFVRVLDVIEAGRSALDSGRIDKYQKDSPFAVNNLNSREELYSIAARVKSKITKEDVQRAAGKGFAVTQTKDGQFILTRAGFKPIKVDVVGHIPIDAAAFERSYHKPPTAEEMARGASGVYLDGVIQISPRGDQFTIDHELTHAFIEGGVLSFADLRAILKSAGVDPSKLSKANVRDYEEQIAAHIEAVRMKRAEAKGAAAQIIQRILDFIDRMVNLVHRTARGVVRDIESGQVFGYGPREQGRKTETPAYETAAAKWYSQMEQFLSRKLANGTPQQIAGNLKSWAAKGEFKQDELDWSGVIPWLESQTGKVKKDDVLSWLKENNVRLEEVVKEETETADGWWYINRGEIEPWAGQTPDGVQSLVVYADTEFEALQLADRYDNESLDEDVEDDVYTDIDDMPSWAQAAETKFSQWVLPGGKNYKELLLTMPPIKTSRTPKTLSAESARAAIKRGEVVEVYQDGAFKKNVMDIGAFEGINAADPAVSFKEYVSPTYAKEYRGSHWEEPNVLAHTRFTEREQDGERILHIEEIQSDWHQAGREKGYRGKRSPDIDFAIQEIEGRYPRVDFEAAIMGYGEGLIDQGVSVEDEAAYSALLERHSEAMGKVPDAPFKTTEKWATLAFKRMVRYAAENGFDRIAWTAGKESAERYNLSKQISRLEAHDVGGGKYNVFADDHSGTRVLAKKDVPEAQLSDIVGKELAQKIIDAPFKRSEFTGLDLQVGGEGMKGFYDKILPAAVKGFFGKKAWGNPNVGTMEITAGQTFEDGSDANPTMAPDVRERAKDKLTPKKVTVWTIPITPEMKSKAMREGMPRYSFAGPKSDRWMATPAVRKVQAPTGQRYEIDDSAATVREGLKPGRHTLEGVMDHPELYEAYPSLKKLPVLVVGKNAAFSSGLETAQAVYSPMNTMIELRSGAISKEAIIHEVQHAIQHIEGVKFQAVRVYNPIWPTEAAAELKHFRKQFEGREKLMKMVYDKLVDTAFTSLNRDQQTRRLESLLRGKKTYRTMDLESDEGAIASDANNLYAALTMKDRNHIDEHIAYNKDVYENIYKTGAMDLILEVSKPFESEAYTAGKRADMPKEMRPDRKPQWYGDKAMAENKEDLDYLGVKPADIEAYRKTLEKRQGVLAMYSVRDAANEVTDTVGALGRAAKQYSPRAGGWVDNLLSTAEWAQTLTGKKVFKARMDWNDNRQKLFHEADARASDKKRSLFQDLTDIRNRGIGAIGRMASTEMQDVQNARNVSPIYKEVARVIRDMDVNEIKWGQYPKADLEPEVIAIVSDYRSSMDKLWEYQYNAIGDIVRAYADQGKPLPELYKDPVTKQSVTLKDLYDEMGKLKGTYAPRIWDDGDFEVWSKDNTGQLWLHKTTTKAGSFKLGRKLERQGHSDINYRESEKFSEELWSDLSIGPTAKLLESAAGKMDMDPEVAIEARKALLEEAAIAFKERAFRKHRLERTQRGGKEVRGYIEDPLARYLIYSTRTSGGIAKSNAALEMFKALNGEYHEFKRDGDRWTYTGPDGSVHTRALSEDDQKNAKSKKTFRVGGLDPKNPRDRAEYDKWYRYIKEQMKNPGQVDRVIAMGKAVVSMKYLSSPKSAIINTTSVITNGPAAVRQYATGAKASFAETTAALVRGGRDYIRIMRGGKLSDADEQAFMDRIRNETIDRPQFMRDAMGAIRTAQGTAFAKTMELFLKPFSITEQWNRGTTLLAAYRMAKRHLPGLSETEIQEKAIDATLKAHGIYDRATDPMWAMGDNPAAHIAKMGYTYQKYGHNWMQMMVDLGFRKKDIKGALWLAASPMFLGGTMGSVAMIGVLPLVAVFLKGSGDDRDPEKWFYDTLRELLGIEGEKIVRYGAFGALGMDMSGSLGLHIGAPRNFRDLTGPFGGVAKDIETARDYFSSGQYDRAAEVLAPNLVRNVMTAIRELNGVVTVNGRRIWNEDGKPYVPSGYESAVRAIGARSADRAMIQAKDWEAKRQKEKFKNQRDIIYDMLRATIYRPDQTKQKDVFKRIQKYNQGLIDTGLAGQIPFVTRQSIQQQYRLMTKPPK